MSGAGQKPVLGHLEEELLDKIIDEREKHHQVGCKMITVWEQELATAHNLEDFQPSRGWLYNFMRRSNLSMRRRTTTGQAWKQVGKEIIKKSFDMCGITTSDQDKIHLMGDDQLTEEDRVLLGESNPNIELSKANIRWQIARRN